MKELYCEKQSSIHNLNARVKLIFTLVLLICTNITPSGAWAPLILFFSVLLGLILLSQINFKNILLRSLISTPFVLAAIPLVFTGPEPSHILTIGHGFQLHISEAGSLRFISISLKSWLSLIAAILLTATTGYSALLTAFRKLGLPLILVSILSLMWRYLSLMVEEAQRLMQARNSRSVGNNKYFRAFRNIFWRAQVTGKMAGNLFLRSIERSDRVYAAMCSRGYNGEPLSSEAKPITKNDNLILIIAILLLLVITLTSIFYLS